MKDFSDLTVARVREIDPTIEQVRVRFGRAETGWGGILAPGYILVMNTPLEPRLHFNDVCVEAGQDDRGFVLLGNVVHRVYARKSVLRYAAPRNDEHEADRIFERLCDAFRDAMLTAEGHVTGVAMISHQNDTDIAEALGAAGIDPATWAIVPFDMKRALEEVFFRGPKNKN